MLIFVKTLTGRTLTVECGEFNDIANNGIRGLKELISEHEEQMPMISD